MEQPQHNAARSPEGTATPSAVQWREVRAARPVSVPPGAPAAPLHRPPQPASTVRPSTIPNIEEHFPGVHCWWGLHTCRWWAYVPTPRGGCLLEAATTDALIAQIAERVERRPWRANRR
jgi:hypothetical protein